MTTAATAKRRTTARTQARAAASGEQGGNAIDAQGRAASGGGTFRGTFGDEIPKLPLDALERRAETAGRDLVKAALAAQGTELTDVAALLSPAASTAIDALATRARDATLRRFGATIQLYAPIYLSNACVNTCTYCGFSMKNRIPRRTLSVAEVRREAEFLTARGFRHILLVAGEHPRDVSPGYVRDCVARVCEIAPFVQIEVQAHEQSTYENLRAAGLDGVVLYQETYDRETYDRVHIHGMKRDMDFRLGAADRVGRSGVKQMGIGVLLGLSARWRRDVLALVAHARYLQRRHWRMHLTVSLPRFRPASTAFEPPVRVTDSEFIQAVCAVRLALPDVGMVLSTRESPSLRDALVGLGITHMSAGSSTEPGGYASPDGALEQFSIHDARAPVDVAEAIASAGYEPVWKDWERGL